VFTRSAIISLILNLFGWNLEHSEYIVGCEPPLTTLCILHCCWCHLTASLYSTETSWNICCFFYNITLENLWCLDCAISGTTGWACWLHRLPVRLYEVYDKLNQMQLAFCRPLSGRAYSRLCCVRCRTFTRWRYRARSCTCVMCTSCMTSTWLLRTTLKPRSHSSFMPSCCRGPTSFFRRRPTAAGLSSTNGSARRTSITKSLPSLTAARYWYRYRCPHIVIWCCRMLWLSRW